MNYLTADESMDARLRGIFRPVEIRDKEGKVLGHYTPVVSPERIALHEKTGTLFDLDEAMLAATEREGLPLSEVWKKIRAQESQG